MMTSISPLSLPSLSSQSHPHQPIRCLHILHTTHILKFSPKTSSTVLNHSRCLRATGRSSNANDPTKEPSPMAAFLDEKGGVVEDMDGYLNNLSLEYESVWDTKPSWCQPWTIALTGMLAIASSWLVLHSVIVTILVSTLICAWWYIFLYSYPKAYSDMIAARRQNITDGVEDTFGVRNFGDR